MRRLAVLVFAAFAILALVLLRSDDLRDADVKANQAAARQACLSGNQTRAAVADVFLFMQQLVEADGEPRTPKQEQQMREFFDGVAFRLKPVPCTEGETP